MAVAAPSGETLVRTMAERGTPTAREQGSEVAAKAYKDLQQKEGSRKVIDIVAARKDRADEKSARKTINENIGEAPSDRVTGAKTRTAAEQARFDRATRAEDLNLKFLREGKGYENLSATERQIVRRSVAEEMRQWPGVEDLLTGKTPAERNVMIDEWLKDSAFFDKVKDLHSSRVVNPDSKIAGSLGEKQKALTDKAKEIQEAGRERTKTKTKLTSEQASYERYWAEERVDPANPTGPKIPGEKLAELTKLKEAKELQDGTDPNYVQVREATVKEWSERIEDLRKREANLATAKSVDRAALDKATTDYNNAISERGKVNAEISSYRARDTKIVKLEQQKTEQERRIEGFKQKDAELFDKQKSLAETYREAKLQRDELSIGREASEEDFVKSTEDIFKDALGELWIERATLLQDEVNKRIDAELADPSIDPMTKKLLEQTKVYWDKLDVDKGTLGALRKGGKVEVKTDKDKLDRSIDHLSRFGDETLIRDILYETKNPETGNDFTVAEVDAKIAADPDFVKNNRDTVVNALVAKGLVAKRLDQKKLDLLVSKGLVEESQLIDIISNNAEVKKAFEKSGIGAAQIEWLKKNKKVSMWLLLMLLSPGLGSVVGAGVLSTKLVKGEFGGKGAAAA